MSRADTRPAALIFRKRLLPYSETFVAAQAHALRRYRPVFVGFHPDKRGLHHLRYEECEFLAESRWRAELRRWRMRHGGGVPESWLQRLTRHRPLLIHAHFGADGHAALPLARALQLPLVTTFHGHDILGDLRPAQQLRNTEVFAQAAAIIAVSRFLEVQLRKAGCPAEKIVQHYIGIDVQTFQPAAARTERPTVLFAGRLVTSKGCRDAIDAVAAIQEAVPQVRLIVVGDGPLRPELERHAGQRLRDCQFTGPVPPERVRELMQQAWVLCGPRRTLASGYAEALGMVFLEAQACGLPVVGYRNGGVAETVVEGETALLCDEGDEGELARNLRQVLTDTPLRQRLSAAASAQVRQRFALQRQTAALEQLYDGWIARSQAGHSV